MFVWKIILFEVSLLLIFLDIALEELIYFVDIWVIAHHPAAPKNSGVSKKPAENRPRPICSDRKIRQFQSKFHLLYSTFFSTIIKQCIFHMKYALAFIGINR